MGEHDSWTDPQNDAPPPVPKKPMSGCMLTSIILGSLGLIGTLVCCGVFAWGVSMIIPTVTKVTAEVAAVGRQILNTEIMESFSPESAMTIDNALLTMRVAQFKHKEGKGEMMIASAKVKFGDPKTATVQSRQFRTNFEDEIRKKLTITKTEAHEITIHGEKVTVSISEATEREGGKAVHIADAEFDQPSGQTVVVIQMDDDVWDQDAVLKMLEETKAPAEEAKAP